MLLESPECLIKLSTSLANISPLFLTPSRLPLDNIRSKLLRAPTYVAQPALTVDFHWKDVSRDRYVVKDTRGPQSITPAEFIMVGQVSHRPRHLGPVGNFNPKFDNPTMDKAKFTFFLEMPEDEAFARDYVSGVEALKQLQAAGGKKGEPRGMIEDLEAEEADVRFVADLFRTKVSFSTNTGAELLFTIGDRVVEMNT